MTPTLRAELDRIEQFLMGPEGRDLAAVFSALRGPDDCNLDLKMKTTAWIRGAAFPKLRNQYPYDPNLFVVGWSFDKSKKFTLPVKNSHFRRHIVRAAKVLELIP